MAEKAIHPHPIWERKIKDAIRCITKHPPVVALDVPRGSVLKLERTGWVRCLEMSCLAVRLLGIDKPGGLFLGLFEFVHHQLVSP